MSLYSSGESLCLIPFEVDAETPQMRLLLSIRASTFLASCFENLTAKNNLLKIQSNERYENISG